MHKTHCNTEQNRSNQNHLGQTFQSQQWKKLSHSCCHCLSDALPLCHPWSPRQSHCKSLCYCNYCLQTSLHQRLLMLTPHQIQNLGVIWTSSKSVQPIYKQTVYLWTNRQRTTSQRLNSYQSLFITELCIISYNSQSLCL